MSITGFNSYKAAIDAGWTGEAKSKGLTTKLDKDLKELVANFERMPTLENHEKIKFFAENLSTVIHATEERATSISQPAIDHTGNVFIRALGSAARGAVDMANSALGRDPAGDKRELVTSLRETESRLQGFLGMINPSSWSSETLPPAQLEFSNPLRRELEAGQVDRDLSDRGVCKVWDNKNQSWIELPSSKTGATGSDTRAFHLREMLKANGAREDAITNALSVGTQDTFNQASLALAEKGKQLGGIEYTSYFAVDNGRVKVMLEGSGEVSDFGTKGTGEKNVDLRALYNPVANSEMTSVKIYSEVFK